MGCGRLVFGPVASRRLGRSLGVDIVPHKHCTLDCIFCEVGPTTYLTVKRRPYVAPGPIVQQVEAALEDCPAPDFITITGSGEPTLNSHLGQIIAAMQSLNRAPVALLTNGTLFYRPEVRQEASLATVVLPTLDATDQTTFEQIHRPHPTITLENTINGLVQFRHEYRGQIWLEVFLVEGINTSFQQIAQLKAIIDRIAPEKIHLNTAVRPTSALDVPAPPIATLTRIAEALGPMCQLIVEPGDMSAGVPARGLDATAVLQLLRRRPSTIDQMAKGLGMADTHLAALVEQLVQAGLVRAQHKDDQVFYMAVPGRLPGSS